METEITAIFKQKGNHVHFETKKIFPFVIQ
jgi:hypothetical protein